MLCCVGVVAVGGGDVGVVAVLLLRFVLFGVDFGFGVVVDVLLWWLLLLLLCVVVLLGVCINCGGVLFGVFG